MNPARLELVHSSIGWKQKIVRWRPIFEPHWRRVSRRDGAMRSLACIAALHGNGRPANSSPRDMHECASYSWSASLARFPISRDRGEHTAKGAISIPSGYFQSQERHPSRARFPGRGLRCGDRTASHCRGEAVPVAEHAEKILPSASKKYETK